MKSVVERFLKYIQIDTQSDESSQTCPSSSKQLDLARILEVELKTIGMKEVVRGQARRTNCLVSNHRARHAGCSSRGREAGKMR